MASKTPRRPESSHSVANRNLNILCMDFSLHAPRLEDFESGLSSTVSTVATKPGNRSKSFSDSTRYPGKPARRNLSVGDTGQYFPGGLSSSEKVPSSGVELARPSSKPDTQRVATKPQDNKIRSISKHDFDHSVASTVDNNTVTLVSSDKGFSPVLQPERALVGPTLPPIPPLLDKGKGKAEEPAKPRGNHDPSYSPTNTPDRRSLEILEDKIPEIEPAPVINLDFVVTPKAISKTNSNENIKDAGKDLSIIDDEEAQNFRRVRFWQRWRQQVKTIYAPEVPPELILPTGPTDEEKYCYLKTNRLGLYSFGVLSFLSLSVGMWLFVICAVPFYWFGVLVALLQTYLVVSYTVSIVGKDYDFEAHKKALAENPILPETCPTVDVYLPCCKEPIEVLENTYQHVQKLIYPEGKLKVYVLDDGASDEVKALATSFGFNYICREDRPRLKKAGNLRWAFTRTQGDFFNIYDADFCPRPDFLMEVIPQHLAYPDTAIFQTPQFFRTSPQQTWVEQGASSVQELFYRVIEVNRNRWGASICVGSNAVYRREALKEVGGTAEIGFSEDVHTGFYAMTRGWKVRYLPLCLACGICPDTPRAFFSQQMRWCMGSTTLLTNPEFWRSSLNPIQKICFLSGMMYYSAISLSIFINPLPGIFLIWVRPDFVRFYNLAFAIPSIFYSLIAIRMWAKASYGMNVQFIMVIQSYAYLTAIKDRLFGRALAWVPSGDTKAHKNNKYRNMRILCWTWNSLTMSLLISGVTYRVINGLAWYETLPVLILDTFNVFLAHRFLLCSGAL